MRGEKMSLDKGVACFKELDFRPTVENFEHCLIIQKAVYLLQLKGIKAGFGYHLYVRGPYSKELTEQIYGNRKRVERLEGPANLSAAELKGIQEFKELFCKFKPSILEIAATYSF